MLWSAAGGGGPEDSAYPPRSLQRILVAPQLFNETSAPQALAVEISLIGLLHRKSATSVCDSLLCPGGGFFLRTLFVTVLQDPLATKTM